MLRKAIAASEIERRRIASDLHDGVVQDLAGVSYALVGCADRISKSDRPHDAECLYNAAGGVRQSIRTLRSLLVEIYPPSLRSAGLAAALTDLLAPLTGRGVAVDLDVPSTLVLPADAEALVFRVAQEAVRNALLHADPRSVGVHINTGRSGVALTVRDDGTGFDVSAAPEEGIPREGPRDPGGHPHVVLGPRAHPRRARRRRRWVPAQGRRARGTAARHPGGGTGRVATRPEGGSHAVVGARPARGVQRAHRPRA